MAENESNPHEDGAKPGAGHEVEDASARGLAIFAIIFFSSLVVVLLIGWGVLALVEHEKNISEAANVAHPLKELMPGTPPGAQLEPEPSHDVLPSQDLIAVRRREGALLSQWSWVDAGHHFARIPLEQATDIAVSQGLPLTLPATQPTTQPGLPPASAVHGPGGLP